MAVADVTNPSDPWLQLAPAARRSLELAHISLCAGGLAVGSALAGPTGQVLADGRNRAYDPPGGEDRLQGSPLAHAELNVLAALATDQDLRSDTLWSTQQPCSMCDAALVFTGVGTVCWLAPDPWSRASGADETRAGGALRRVPPQDDRWLIVASVLFLASIAMSRGLQHPTVVRNHVLEPETAALLLELLPGGTAKTSLMEPLPVVLPHVWDRVQEAAVARRLRTAI